MNININHITKIEGHAKLHIKIEKNEIKKVKLNIYEGARFFESLLKNKHYDDLPHISSRICGVCSQVHTFNSINTIENAFKFKPNNNIKLLRELSNIGGQIQSHILHLYLLALPDYFGYNNILEMRKEHKEKILRALKIKKVGNLITKIVSGRDVHPIDAIPGGFGRIPNKKQLDMLKEELTKIEDDAIETIKLFSKLKNPKIKVPTTFLALSDKSYFYSTKTIISNDKETFSKENYQEYLTDFLKKDSTATFTTKKDIPYTVGAQARIICNGDLLKNKYISKIKENNPYHNNLAQAIEVYEGIKRSQEILKHRFKPEKAKKITIRNNTAIGALEAPRGILFHKYKFNNKGYCDYADIITPTSQNLPSIEKAIKILLPNILHLKKEKIILEVEKLIRAYDPCISCSTHFLDVIFE